MLRVELSSTETSRNQDLASKHSSLNKQRFDEGFHLVDEKDSSNDVTTVDAVPTSLYKSHETYSDITVL